MLNKRSVSNHINHYFTRDTSMYSVVKRHCVVWALSEQGNDVSLLRRGDFCAAKSLVLHNLSSQTCQQPKSYSEYTVLQM